MPSTKNLTLCGGFMKSVIFSIYINIDDQNLDDLEGYLGDDMSRSKRTKQQLLEYKQQLIDCKKEYADLCDAEFVLYTNDQQYHSFLQSMSHHDIKEFDKINFYKIYLMEQLAQRYDRVLYLDLDVVPTTNKNFFTANDITKFCVHCVTASKENTWGAFVAAVNRQGHCQEHNCTYTYDHVVESHLDSYHWYTKKLCKDAMLMHHGMSDSRHLLANTAIMGGSGHAIKEIKFFDRMNEMIETFQAIKQEQIMGSTITDKFFINNEVLMTYLIIKENIQCNFLPSAWHYVQLDIYKNFCSKSEAHFVHVVDKKFEKIWRDHV